MAKLWASTPHVGLKMSPGLPPQILLLPLGNVPPLGSLSCPLPKMTHSTQKTQGLSPYKGGAQDPSVLSQDNAYISLTDWSSQFPGPLDGPGLCKRFTEFV